MKWTFQLALYEMMKRDERILLIWGDVGKTMFKRHVADFPARCINPGICEQATVSMAAGLAMEGYRPIVYTITPFLIERAFEQIKIDVDQMNLPVGLVGYSDNSAGPTHIERSDMILSSLWPNVFRMFPRSDESLRVMMSAINFERPWFLSLKPTLK